MKIKTLILTCLVYFFASMSTSAQTIVKGDMNGDGQVTVADVTSVVNTAVGKTPMETINVGTSGNPYMVDNSTVLGTWYASDGTHFSLNADGTTDFPGGATYEFMPIHGDLLIYDATGIPVKALHLIKVATEYLLATDYLYNITYYTNSSFIVSGITLSQSPLTLPIHSTAQLTATVTPSNAPNPRFAWSSSDTNIATVDQNGLVTAVSGGTCTITCASKDGSGVTATCEVIVFEEDNSGSIGGHDYIDLGLPSGTLWATCNIGADNPEDYGDYFSWGETTGYNSGKTNFEWSTYKWCNGSYDTQTKYNTSSSYGTVDNKTELDLEDDAAYVNWGSNWRMPSKAQFDELINGSYTTTEWTTQNGVNGLKITSKTNGNSIFLPAAGYRNDTSLNDAGSYGYYWSHTLYSSYPYRACSLYFNSSYFDTYRSNRCGGLSVRPVRVSQ